MSSSVYAEYDQRTGLLTLTGPDGARLAAGPLTVEERVALVEQLLPGTPYDIAPAPRATTPTGPDLPACLVPPLGVDPHQPPELSTAAVAQVWQAIAGAPVRNRLIALLVGVHGLRPFEVVHLSMSDVLEDVLSWNRTGAALHCEGPNGRRRRVTLDHHTARVLAAWTAERAELLEEAGREETIRDGPLIISLARPITAAPLDQGRVTEVLAKLGQAAMGNEPGAPRLSYTLLQRSTYQALRGTHIGFDMAYWDPLALLTQVDQL